MIGRTDRLHVADAPQGDSALAILRRLIGIGGLNHTGRLRDRAELLDDQIERFGLVYFARHQQHRVVRLIVVAPERLKPLNGNLFDVGACADSRVAVVVPQVGRRDDALLKDIGRAVFAGLVLVSHNGHFAVEVFTGDKRVHHTVGFEIERPVEVGVGRLEGLEIVGSIKPGGSIGACAVLGEFLRDVGMFCRAFEHQVFQQVRHAGLAIAFVARPDEVGDVDRNGLFGRVGEEQDFQAVGGQPIFGDSFDGGDALDPGGQRRGSLCAGFGSADDTSGAGDRYDQPDHT